MHGGRPRHRGSQRLGRGEGTPSNSAAEGPFEPSHLPWQNVNVTKTALMLSSPALAPSTSTFYVGGMLVPQHGVLHTSFKLTSAFSIRVRALGCTKAA